MGVVSPEVRNGRAPVASGGLVVGRSFAAFRRGATCVLVSLALPIADGSLAGTAVAQCVSCPGGVPEVAPGATVLVTNPDGRTLTVSPAGGMETLESLGITVRVQVWCAWLGQPPPVGFVCGVPAEEILLFNPEICMCAAWHAARPTDDNGETEF